MMCDEAMAIPGIAPAPSQEQKAGKCNESVPAPAMCQSLSRVIVMQQRRRRVYSTHLRQKKKLLLVYLRRDFSRSYIPRPHPAHAEVRQSGRE